MGPGSSKRDYDALGVPFEERWKRFDEAVAVLRALLEGEPCPRTRATTACRPTSSSRRRPGRRGIPLWIGSWGSKAGLRSGRAGRRRLARLRLQHDAGPLRRRSRALLARELEERGRDADGFPNALATMWTWVSEGSAEGDRVLADVLAPLLKRDPDELRGQVCVGPAEHCAELLSRYAEAGCQRVYLWPLGDERRQLELVASEVAPRIELR